MDTLRFLVRDRDTKFVDGFDAMLHACAASKSSRLRPRHPRERDLRTARRSASPGTPRPNPDPQPAAPATRAGREPLGARVKGSTRRDHRPATWYAASVCRPAFAATAGRVAFAPGALHLLTAVAGAPAGDLAPPTCSASHLGRWPRSRYPQPRLILFAAAGWYTECPISPILGLAHSRLLDDGRRS